MNIQIRIVDQVTIVEMAGEIDGKTAPSAQEQIVPLTQNGGKMLLDMTQVSYMSSAGLRVLLMLYRQMTSHAGQITLVGISEEIKDTMSVTGFLKFFAISETVDSALATMQS